MDPWGRRLAPDEHAVADPPLRLRSASRGWRVALLLAVGGCFLAGSLVGQDDWWPLSPWRMFSTSQPATGAVVELVVERRTTADPRWHPAPLTPSAVGLTRAEVEGRVDRVVAEPSLLRTLAVSHRRLRPQEPRWTGVRVIRRATVIVDRRPTGEVRSTVIASWSAA